MFSNVNFDKKNILSSQVNRTLLARFLPGLHNSDTRKTGRELDVMFSCTFLRCSEAFRVDIDYQYAMISFIYVTDIY